MIVQQYCQVLIAILPNLQQNALQNTGGRSIRKFIVLKIIS
jgi:hypothetical protein